MKRIVIVDDCPWRIKDSILQLQDQGISFYMTVYYPNKTLSWEDQKKLMQDYEESTGIQVVQVNNQNEFVTKMDEIYPITDIIFFVDYDLKGDMSPYDFYTRVNVKYALAKDQEEKKIWFYTTGPSDIKGLLWKTFPNRVISTPDCHGHQYGWDISQVQEAVRE